MADPRNLKPPAVMFGNGETTEMAPDRPSSPKEIYDQFFRPKGAKPDVTPSEEPSPPEQQEKPSKA